MELLTSTPRSDFMAQSLLLSIDECPGLGISPLQTNIWLSFSQADLRPRSAQELFFSGFLKSLKLFFRRFVLIASGTEIFWRVSLKHLTFDGNIAFPLSPVFVVYYSSAVRPPQRGDARATDLGQGPHLRRGVRAGSLRAPEPRARD